jgi:curved DNA-binding protein CbpA
MANYYEILGVKFDASQKEIRSAYVKQIKKFHPDLYPNKQEALKQTQLINEAYATLKDPIKRIEYDNKIQFESKARRENYVEHEDDIKDNSAPKEVPHFQCDICGRKNSSLRVTIFIYVVSLFYVSWQKGWGKILCNRCRIKYAILWNLEVWLLGWWSIYGFLYSIEAIFKNIKGGIQPEENNSSLLSILAYDFYLKNDYEEAYNAIKNSLKYKYSKEAEDFQNYLSNLIEKPKKTNITDRIFSANPLYFTVPSLLLTLLATIFLFSITFKRSTPSYIDYYSNQKYKTQTKQGFNKPIPELKIEFNEPELPFPKNGTVIYNTRKKAIAPLKIITRYSDNYYLKLEDKFSKETVVTIFIEGGKSAEIDIPLGTYYLKYAVGKKWYGEKFHFGPYTSYYKAMDEFIFEIQGEQVLGYTLELYKQPGGNLREEIISVNDF